MNVLVCFGYGFSQDLDYYEVSCVFYKNVAFPAQTN